MTLSVGDKVEVYRNLRTDNFSIRKDGIVHDRADEVIISNAVFSVGQKSRERVIKERRKNVHAVVRGIYKGSGIEVDINTMNEGYYNPYETKTFVDKESNLPLSEASKVYLKEGKVFYI